MIEIYGPEQLPALRRAGRVAAETLAAVGARVGPGVSTANIERWVREDTQARGARPSQLGYKGFPFAVCTSKNQVVCHGMPSTSERLEPGDIVNVDVTSEIGGFHGDTSITFHVGEPTAEAKHLIAVTRRALAAGIGVVRAGARLGDIGAAIQAVAEPEGLSVVREYCGHGIGRAMHQEPQVPHVGEHGRGLRLRAGMVITIEPMLNLGGPEVRTEADGWTVVTVDGRWSAQFEHTIYVTEEGAEVLTHRP